MADDSILSTDDISYSPAALLQVFNSALAPGPTKRIVRLKGRYLPGKGVAYNGVFYDTLKDEATDAQLTLIVPALLRGKLAPDKTVEIFAYITKRVVLNASRIEIQATVTELLTVTDSAFTDKDYRAIEIQQRKADLSYRDVDGFIRGKIARAEAVQVVILVGRTAIIDSDIRHALGEAIGFYDVSFQSVNLSSEPEIVQALRRFNDPDQVDLLILARGGGENMEVFNSPELADQCVDLKPYFLTAIGHKENTSLVQKVADKHFITPTDLGNYLNRVYNESIEAQQHSKAKLVEAARKELQVVYEKNIQNLQEKIQQLEQLSGKSAGVQQQEMQLMRERLQLIQLQYQEQQGQLDRTLEAANAYRRQAEVLRQKNYPVKTSYVLVLVIVAVVCWLMGRGC